MEADSSEKRKSENSYGAQDYYAVFLEWNRAGVANGRHIVVRQQPMALYNELSEWISTAAEAVYEQMPMQAGHDDFADLFGTLVENYWIPDGFDESLSSADVRSALGQLLSNKYEELSQGEDLERILNEIGTFLSTINLFLIEDRSYVALSCKGKLPEFVQQVVKRELVRYSNLDQRGNVSPKEACWFGRLSIEMAAKGSWIGTNTYDRLLGLIEEFNEMNEIT